ncbi:hypothetical protein BV898_18465 [Hypsibius exemplaris]|uniref:Uncharacterized protein n=1 Tax=Hypsibius exemplaris TaxID=2072580 RepID=A0A9X6NJC4_HYPEX|nr:hypothetical protein BV898_18465 [Hypsibius exemplaris]
MLVRGGGSSDNNCGIPSDIVGNDNILASSSSASVRCLEMERRLGKGAYRLVGTSFVSYLKLRFACDHRDEEILFTRQNR